MKSRLRKKKNKPVGRFYHGLYIEKNSPYSHPNSTYRVVLFYCPIEGVEIYFKTIGHARSYLNSIYTRVRDTRETKKNDIPF